MTPRGLIQFKVMPFGLHGAMFQHLMNTILGPCEGYTLAYLDDIFVYSRTWSHHLEHLAQLFRLTDRWIESESQEE